MLKAVIGLGNPGEDYAKTRHNLGYFVLDKFSEKISLTWKVNKFIDASVACGFSGKNKIILIKPLTYMNLSGRSVMLALRFYKIKLDNVLVVYDDFNLDIGVSKLQNAGADGGHNGISDIILKNGKEFSRFRLGIKPSYTDNTILSQFVLMPFTKGEAKVIDEVLPIWLESLKLAIDKGVDIAMNFTNKKLKNEYNQNQ